MTTTPAHPKPKDQKRKPDAVRVFRGGREVCNFLTKEGHDVYEQRKRAMWERQGRRCCLYGHIPECPGKLNWADTTFDHEVPRGYDGATRDDRIEIRVKKKDGTIKVRWQNGAAHLNCNTRKGSRRIDYNAAHNGDIVWELIQRATRTGKVLYRCKSCGYETPAPTKNHECKTGEA
jgi:hypothetical protein